MARLLVHTKAPSLHPTDDTINSGMFRPGHVVTILEDGEQFGTLGSWNTVIEVPGTPKADLEYLLSPDSESVSKVFGEERSESEAVKSVRMWKAKDVNTLKLVSGMVNVKKGQELAFTTSYFEKTVSAVKAAVIG